MFRTDTSLNKSKFSSRSIPNNPQNSLAGNRIQQRTENPVVATAAAAAAKKPLSTAFSSRQIGRSASNLASDSPGMIRQDTKRILNKTKPETYVKRTLSVQNVGRSSPVGSREKKKKMDSGPIERFKKNCSSMEPACIALSIVRKHEGECQSIAEQGLTVQKGNINKILEETTLITEPMHPRLGVTNINNHSQPDNIEEMRNIHGAEAHLKEINEQNICPLGKQIILQLNEKINNLELQKIELQQNLDISCKTVEELKLTYSQLLEENRNSTVVIEQIKSQLELERTKFSELKLKLDATIDKFNGEKAEWLQLQKDLQTAIVVADNVRAEAEEKLCKVVALNQDLNGCIAALKEELQVKKIETFQPNFEDTIDEHISDAATVSSKPETMNFDNIASRHLGEPTDCVKVSLHVKEQDHTMISQSVTGLFNQCPQSSGLCLKPSQIQSSVSLPQNRHENSRENVSYKDDFCRFSPCRRSASTSNIPSPASDLVKQAVVSDDVKAAAMNSMVMCGSFGNSAGREQLTDTTYQLTDSSVTFRLASSISSEKLLEKTRPVSLFQSDPLICLAKQMGGSKRNALLRWCQRQTEDYRGVDITNFSSSWNDGLALCALIHSFHPHRIPYKELDSQNKLKNFSLAFQAIAEIGIPANPQLIQVFLSERPNWQEVILFISSIYKHFEVDGISSQKMKPNLKPASDGAYAVESLDALSTKT